MKFFIVAIVFITGQEDPTWMKMKMEFEDKATCQAFYEQNPSVTNDILTMFPNQKSHSLVCISERKLNELMGETENEQQI